MSDKEREWLVKLVQDRYEWLLLNQDQAEAIYSFETGIEKVHSDNFIPSFWEEKEIESYFFKQILTEKQFELYSNSISKQMKDSDLYLIESDKDASSEIDYNKKLLQFYKDDLVPKLILHKKKNRIGYLPGIKSRIDFLKVEHNEYLKVRLKEVCVSHFRYARNLQPNKFRAELLRHEIEKVLPSYYFFEKSSDNVIKEISVSLIGNMKYEFKIYIDFITSINGLINSSTDKIHQEFYAENTSGFPIIELGGERTESQKKEDGFLSYLLIDNEKYGQQSPSSLA